MSCRLQALQTHDKFIFWRDSVSSREQSKEWYICGIKKMQCNYIIAFWLIPILYSHLISALWFSQEAFRLWRDHPGLTSSLSMSQNVRWTTFFCRLSTSTSLATLSTSTDAGINNPSSNNGSTQLYICKLPSAWLAHSVLRHFAPGGIIKGAYILFAVSFLSFFFLSLL